MHLCTVKRSNLDGRVPGLISYLPLDPLHLVNLGVVKKLIGLRVRNRKLKASGSVYPYLLVTSEVDELAQAGESTAPMEQGFGMPANPVAQPIASHGEFRQLCARLLAPSFRKELVKIYVKWNSVGRINLYELEAAFIRRLKRSLDAASKRVQRHPTEFVFKASPTLDNLDTFLRFCNLDDCLHVQWMINAGSEGFAPLIGGLCSQQGRISMISRPLLFSLRFDPAIHDKFLLSHLHWWL
ncbi:unnamed protein product [Schistocephalus solidus]|uniref:HECT domain-containing protein n=1 Tax=Schistocephalus solidus TaxID=70667 RepID=A0A183T9J8_SCHSO|nr:unnamed protein product [Schistocephalus solidus]